MKLPQNKLNYNKFLHITTYHQASTKHIIIQQLSPDLIKLTHYFNHTIPKDKHTAPLTNSPQ
jgi:hypothetical protein